MLFSLGLCLTVGAQDRDAIVEILEQSFFDEAPELETLTDKIKFLVSKPGMRQISQNLKVHETYLKVLRTSRAYKKNEIMKNHIYNLGMLLPFSELSEVLAGPITYSLTSGSGLSNEFVAVSTAVASTFALPGIDPICFLVVSLYFIDPVQKGVTKVRKTLVKNILVPINGFFFKRLSKQKNSYNIFLQSMIEYARKNALSWSLKKNNRSQVFSLLTHNGSVSIEFSKNSDNELFLESVSSGNLSPEIFRTAIKSLAKSLSLDTRLAIKEYLRKSNSETYSKKAYVKEAGADKVVFTKKSISLGARQWHSGLMSCQLSLN